MQKDEKLQDKLERLSDELAECIYPLTFKFPTEEKFALSDQIRRSSISVPANIIEGLARETDKEKRRFMFIAISSLAELKYLVYFASKRGYIYNSYYNKFKDKADILSKLLGSFIKVLKH